MPEKYQLEIFGQIFELTTKDGKKDDLIKVANYFKKVIDKLKKKLPNRPHLEIAVLAGLMVTDDLYNTVQSKNEKQKNFESMSLNDKQVDEILNNAIKQLEISLKL